MRRRSLKRRSTCHAAHPNPLPEGEGTGRSEIMNVLGVILARGGSQGLKSKHLLPLLGRPVISYTFDHARASKLLTRVVVSTDCPQIRHLAESAFFETIARPPELATSDAS